MLPLACYNDKKFYQETLPEAICCCLQTCLLLIFILLIEYFMYRDGIKKKGDKIGMVSMFGISSNVKVVAT